MNGILAELRRRNVFRVAVTYGVAAWIVAQVAGLAADAFDAPAWVMQMIITALVIGFLPAVVVAWAFELTPEGIRRERDLVDREAVNRYTARRLDIAVIILLVAAIGLVIGDRLLFRSAPTAPVVVQTEPGWTLDSIAVLPFADFSPARDQAWLGEGIADTLLHALSQVDGLRVSARSSSFAYRERAADVATIGRELNVATVLEGSVQRFGERLRISAQLVRTDTQAQLFSHTFERDHDDIFAIQDEIAAAVTEALLGSTGPAPEASARTDLAVYDLYLEGRQAWQERTKDSVNRAVTLLEQAVAADPNYAPAQAELAIALLFQVIYADQTIDSNRAGIERHIERALALDRDNALAWAARGHLLDELGLGQESLDALHRAEELDPGNANIQVWVGNRHFAAGRYNEAARRFERALQLDPLNPFVRQRYMATLGFLNSSDPRIEQIARDTVRLFPDNQQSWTSLLTLLANQDQADEVILLAFQAHRQFPEEPPFVSFIAHQLEYLGLTTEAEAWFDRLRTLAVPDDGWLNFGLLRRNPEEHLARARALHERWGDRLLPDLLTSLRLNDQHEEARELFDRAYTEARPRFLSGEANLEDYSLLVPGMLMARRDGDNDLVDELASLAVDKLDELQEGGLFDNLLIPELFIAVARDDIAEARRLLETTPDPALSYITFLLGHDPAFVTLAGTLEARAVLARSESRQREQVARLRAEAPPGLL